MTDSKTHTNLSLLARRYILNHPSIRDCLNRDLINFSALARAICQAEGIKQFEAVIAACKRFATDRISNRSTEERIKKLIKTARIQVETRVSTIILNKPIDWEKLGQLDKAMRRQKGRLEVVAGADTVTLIISQAEQELAETLFEKTIHSIDSGLAQITMTFDESIERTPGIVAHLYGQLSYHGINIREEMSCWTEMIVVLAERDVGRALEVLSMPEDRPG